MSAATMPIFRPMGLLVRLHLTNASVVVGVDRVGKDLEGKPAFFANAVHLLVPDGVTGVIGE